MSQIKEKVVSLLDNIDELMDNGGFPKKLSEIENDCEIIEQSCFNNDVTWVYRENGATAIYMNGEFSGTAIDLLASAFEANNIELISCLDTFVPVENETYTTLSFAIKKLMQSGYRYPKGGEQTYLMRDVNTGYTKIGKSIDPKRRERGFKCSNLAIELRYVCNSNVETELHQKFADKRVDREWFNLTDEDIMYICRNYNFTKYDGQSE